MLTTETLDGVVTPTTGSLVELEVLEVLEVLLLPLQAEMSKANVVNPKPNFTNAVNVCLIFIVISFFRLSM